MARSNVQHLRQPQHSTVADLTRRLDRGAFRRFLCILLRRHVRRSTLQVVGTVTPQGHRTRQLVVCKACGKAFMGDLAGKGA